MQWAFRQFVFENMHLSQVEVGGLEPPTLPIIPWDDPVSFVRHVRARAAQNAEEHAHGGASTNQALFLLLSRSYWMPSVNVIMC